MGVLSLQALATACCAYKLRPPNRHRPGTNIPDVELLISQFEYLLSGKSGRLMLAE